MQASGWFQFAIYIVALVVITKPMGLYLLQVLDANGRTWLDPVLRPLERVTYRLMGVDSSKEHDWKQYTLAMLLFSLVGCLFTYAILRLQYYLPLNPQKLAGVSPDLFVQHCRQVSPRTPIGRTTPVNQPCRTSRKWSAGFSQFRVAPQPALLSRLLWFVVLRDIRPHYRQLLGRSRPRDLLLAQSRFASCSRSSSCRRA